MITIHKWDCKNCDTRLYLKVDDQNPLHSIKLLGFGSFVSAHCIEKGHEVIHTQKEDFKIKYV